MDKNELAARYLKMRETLSEEARALIEDLFTAMKEEEAKAEEAYKAHDNVLEAYSRLLDRS